MMCHVGTVTLYLVDSDSSDVNQLELEDIPEIQPAGDVAHWLARSASSSSRRKVDSAIAADVRRCIAGTQIWHSFGKRETLLRVARLGQPPSLHLTNVASRASTLDSDSG
jgi:hypothetical protein